MPLGVEPRVEDGGAEFPVPGGESLRAELWSVTVMLPALVSSWSALEECELNINKGQYFLKLTPNYLLSKNCRLYEISYF